MMTCACVSLSLCLCKRPKGPAYFGFPALEAPLWQAGLINDSSPSLFEFYVSTVNLSHRLHFSPTWVALT